MVLLQINHVKGEGKIHNKTGHEDPVGSRVIILFFL